MRTEYEIELVMLDTGMDRLQAIRHIEQRDTLRRRRPLPHIHWSDR